MFNFMQRLQINVVLCICAIWMLVCYFKQITNGIHRNVNVTRGRNCWRRTRA